MQRAHTSNSLESRIRNVSVH